MADNKKDAERKTSSLAKKAAKVVTNTITGAESRVLGIIRKAGENQEGVTVSQIDKQLGLGNERKTRQLLRNAQAAAATHGDLVFRWTKADEALPKNTREYFVIAKATAEKSQTSEDLAAIMSRASDFSFHGQVKGVFAKA